MAGAPLPHLVIFPTLPAAGSWGPLKSSKPTARTNKEARSTRLGGSCRPAPESPAVQTGVGGWACRGSGWPRLDSVGPRSSPASQALHLLLRPPFSHVCCELCQDAWQVPPPHFQVLGAWEPCRAQVWGRGKNTCFGGQLCVAYSPHTLLFRICLPSSSLQSADCLVQRFWNLPRPHPEEKLVLLLFTVISTFLIYKWGSFSILF